MNVSPDFLQLQQHLHRGGTYGYWWNGTSKESTWYTVAAPAECPHGRHNSYFGVHPTSAIPPTNKEGDVKPPEFVRSQVTYIAAINCLFGEYDAKHFADGKAGALARINALQKLPSVIIDSGGGYHCYWLLRETFLLSTDDDRQHAAAIQKAWVAFVGSDDDAKDLARVLRVPGTRNYKKDYAPNYPTVEIVHADFTRLYDLADLEALLPVPAVQPQKGRPATPRATQGASATTADLATIATVAQQLQRLSSDRKDRYSDWLAVGMALRELGAIGLELWDTWSRGSAKYEAGCCAEKWHSIRVDADKITLASLDRWLQEDRPAETPTADDIARMDAETLRQQLRATSADRDRERQRADRLDQWRQFELTILAKPSKELSAAQKIIALGLHIDMERRVQAGKNEPTPILISPYTNADGTTTLGITDRTGLSHDTVSKALPKLAEAGAIAYEQTRDKRTGHTRVLVAPAAYFTPALWSAPTQRNHGGTRIKHCLDCGSTALIEQTRVVCLDCGCQQGEARERTVNTETQDAALGMDASTDERGVASTEPTAETQDAAPKREMVSLVTQVAFRPMPTVPPPTADEPPTSAPPPTNAEPVRYIRTKYTIAAELAARERASSATGT